MPRESKFQKELIDDLEERLPGCYVEKGNSAYRQGVPDLTVYYGPNWAKLEVKKKKPAPSDFEPNQEWYINKFNEMSYAACVYPENKEEVLDAVSSALKAPRRKTRVPRAK